MRIYLIRVSGEWKSLIIKRKTILRIRMYSKDKINLKDTTQ